MYLESSLVGLHENVYLQHDAGTSSICCCMYTISSLDQHAHFPHPFRMRTSRISRDTSRIVAASRTLRQRRTTANVAAHNIRQRSTLADSNGAENILGTASDSELSSVPAELDTDGEAERTSRKRKRGQNAPVLVKREYKQASTVSSMSPQEVEDVKPKKTRRRQPAKKVKTEHGGVKMEPPSNWAEIYALTREMRDENPAPVDTMGCESLAEKHQSPRDQRFQTLIALMLSSQTKDTVNAVAMRNMQEGMPGVRRSTQDVCHEMTDVGQGFNLESVLALEPAALNAFINKVGFHNLKTKYIKQTAEILRDKWNSDIPDTIAGLVSLPGVGPKMAYLALSAAWGRDEGIGVDVHVHRITNLWGWHKTQHPEQTRAALESWLPRDKWHDINNLLVGFGQTICLPVGRKCGDCKLAARGLCPSAVVRAHKTRTKREEAMVMKMEAPAGEHVKTEEVEEAIPDMEDIGVEPRKRTPRTKRP